MLDFDLQTNLVFVEILMRKYRDQPMDLADGCLVRMTEIEPRSLVVTTDKDFKVYRRNGREVVPHVRRHRRAGLVRLTGDAFFGHQDEVAELPARVNGIGGGRAEAVRERQIHPPFEQPRDRKLGRTMR